MTVVMKWLIFKSKVALLFLFSFGLAISTKAQGVRVDTVYVVDTVYLYKKTPQSHQEKTAERIMSKWSRLTPRYAKIQFAGSMGFLSAGTGWDYGKNRQWETDVLFGFVPKYSTEYVKATVTVKQNFIPWSVKTTDRIIFKPFSTGLYVNTIIGEEFWRAEPSKYPNGYYDFSTKLRLNVFVGQSWEYRFAPSMKVFCKSITFFYEFSTNELYLIGSASNKYLKLKDIVGLSLGAKFQFL